MRILYLPNCYSQQRQFQKPANIYPILLASEAEWHRKQGHEVEWYTEKYPITKYPHQLYDKLITEPEGLSFLSLPHPDRKFTRWWDYQDNGNFKYLPATYIQSASGCWYGKCSFCVEKGKPYEIRSPNDIREELFEIGWQGFKEVFDDAATFNSKDRHWWYEVNNAVEAVNKQFGMRFSCNYRMVDDNYELMKLNGFRMLLFGLESANQATLDRINKGTEVEDVKYIIKASKAGLEPHIAVMFGYPWEDDRDAIATLRLVWWLLKKGYAKTAQASLYQPDGNVGHRKYVAKLYNIWKSPTFWISKLREIHDKDDLKYLWKQIKAGLMR